MVSTSPVTSLEAVDLGGISSARGPEHYFLLFAALLESLRSPRFNIRLVTSRLDRCMTGAHGTGPTPPRREPSGIQQARWRTTLDGPDHTEEP